MNEGWYAEGWRIVSPPEPKWELSFTPDFYVRFMMPTAPNAFHRLMQRVFLGVHWRPIKRTP